MGQWPSIEERLWSKVDKSGECWIWLGSKSTGGYGQISYKGKMTRTHRVAYELTKGPIPEGFEVCHNCPDGDNPSCCNPDHLWLGSHKENMLDMGQKGRGRYPRGSKAGPSKLNEEMIKEIRDLYQKGIRQKELAKKYNVTPPAISLIVSRKNWRHVA